jgi:uncharacterized zinc-type alcohol dehydrogenase-like protein
MTSVKAYSANQAKARILPTVIDRREVGLDDAHIEIEHCGVCHTDIHFVNNGWGMINYPVVPGHQIVGRVTEVGSSVTNFKPDDKVAIGYLVDSFSTCANCEKGLEQYCITGFTATYNSETKDASSFTYGGYSTSIVAKESFVLKVPKTLEGPSIDPLLSAAITTYSPTMNWEIWPVKKVGVIGLGGLRHMGVKFSHTLGAHTTMITTSERKRNDARLLRADDALLSLAPSSLTKEKGSFDLLLNTIP